MAMLILLVLLIFFAALGVPLAFAIGASCVSYILLYAPNFIAMLPQRVWNGAYSELMIAMPLFMLAGELMNTGGITQRIINFCMELLRPIREESQRIMDDKAYLENVYQEGAERARRLALKTLSKVQRKVGFVAAK